MTLLQHPLSPALLTLCVLGTLGLGACDLGEKSIGDDDGGTTTTGDGDGDGDDGNTGPTNPEPGTTDLPSSCGEETTSTDTPADMALPGFGDATIESTLALIQGSFAGTMSWLPDDGPITSAHAMTASPMSATVTYAGGEIRLIETELAGELDNQFGEQLCANTLEVDVILEFTTDDGLFAESIPVTVTIVSHEVQPAPSLYHVLDMDAHQGSLSYDDFSVIDDGSVDELFLIGSITEDTFNGSVNTEILWMDFVGFGPTASFESDRLP